MPDIFVLYNGVLYGLECKNEKGKPSPEQLEWGRNIERNGGRFFIVRSVEDVMTALNKKTDH
ncbi:MAG: VRR-NUC domain-containing protein [Patescibacteria group bacterium]|nr:VRR-NUC domain-containing protein [Patescibacteria group bacterium]